MTRVGPKHRFDLLLDEKEVVSRMRFCEVLREEYCRLQSCLCGNFNSEKVFGT